MCLLLFLSVLCARVLLLLSDTDTTSAAPICLQTNLCDQLFIRFLFSWTEVKLRKIKNRMMI